MQQCPKCGGQVEAGVRFCDQCGQNLAAGGAGAVQVTASQSPEAYRMRVGEYVRRGWQVFKQYPWGFIGFTVLTIAISTVLNFIPVIGGLANFAINMPLTMGAVIVASRLMQGQTPEFKEFFSGFHYFLPLLLQSLVITLLIMVSAIPFGAVLFSQFYSDAPNVSLIVIVAVIWGLVALAVATFYFFAPWLVADRRLNFWPAMELSRKTVLRNFLGVLGFSLVLAAIAIVGALALVVGLLVAIPVIECAVAAAYADIFGLQSSSY